MQDRNKVHSLKDDISKKRMDGKILTRFIICLGIFLGILVASALFIPAAGRITWRAELIMRNAKLMGWHKQIKLFMEQNSRLPKSLYEVSLFEDLGIPSVKVSVPQKFNYEEEGNLLSDPNRFFEEVEYELVTHRQGWFIMELKGARYQHRLIIDEKGNIMELRKVKYPWFSDD